MFTGIIEATGHIEAIVKTGADATITIATGKLDMTDVKLGDSIATNGVCLTVTKFGSHYFSADVSAETLKRTTFKNAKAKMPVNLEKAMLPTTRFGGHIVSGHVDGVGVISAIEPLGNAVEYWIEAPSSLGCYIAEKGSITVDGISLTVNDVQNNRFKLTIVPHTALETTINGFSQGQEINLEVDIIARYVERLITKPTDTQTSQSGVTMALLAQSGFLKR